ncbi:MAG: 1-acyl-sn-glycerol-3-phosphate acyltransferase [Bacteroidota bacterium]
MIKATKSEWLKKLFYWFEYHFVLKRRFRKLTINGKIDYPDESILLLQNHFSWWDGFLGSYLCYKYLCKSYHVMVQESQLKRLWYFKYKGAFSVKKKSRELFESLSYAQTLLKDQKNLVLVFPQGRLQSMHTTKIEIEKGISRLLVECGPTCRVLYNAVIVDYFEGFKPTVTFHLLDLGTANEIDTEALPQQISQFHQEAMQKSVRE